MRAHPGISIPNLVHGNILKGDSTYRYNNHLLQSKMPNPVEMRDLMRTLRSITCPAGLSTEDQGF
jgi:hypothetical protein